MSVEFPLEKVRADFPAIGQKINNGSLIYLDSAASSLKPKAVIERLSDFYSLESSNVHRGVHSLSATATTHFEQARQVVQKFLNAKSESEVIWTRGTTESLNLVAQTWGRKHLKAGERILVSEMEHHSNIVPWQMIAEQTGAEVLALPVTDTGDIDLEVYTKLLSENVKLVAVTHCSNTLGTINPVKEMARLAHEHGAVISIDGAQSAPCLPVDVQDLDCDFYAFSAHKTFGPFGMGVLYGKREILEELPPYQGGGSMISEVTLAKTTYNDIPFRFEAGTPHVAGALGLATALEYIDGLGREKIERHEREVLSYAIETLREVEGFTPLAQPKDQVAILSFTVKGTHANDVGEILDQMGIAVRVGHHCTQPLMKRFGVTATTRASFSIYNGRDDVDRLKEGLLKARKLLVG